MSASSTSHNDIIKCLKQELTDSMIPALTRIDMEMMKLHHKLEAVLTKVEKYELVMDRIVSLLGEHDSRLESHIIGSKETTAKTVECLTQLKKDVPLFNYHQHMSVRPPLLPPPRGFTQEFSRFPPPYDPLTGRSPASLASLHSRSWGYYQATTSVGEKGRKINHKNNREGALPRVFTRMPPVLSQSTGQRSGFGAPPASSSMTAGGGAQPQQWTRRGTGVFTSDEDSTDNDEHDADGDSVKGRQEGVTTTTVVRREVTSVTALMKSVTVKNKNKAAAAAAAACDSNNNDKNDKTVSDKNNNASGATPDCDEPSTIVKSEDPAPVLYDPETSGWNDVNSMYIVNGGGGSTGRASRSSLALYHSATITSTSAPHPLDDNNDDVMPPPPVTKTTNASAAQQPVSTAAGGAAAPPPAMRGSRKAARQEYKRGQRSKKITRHKNA